MTRSRLMTILLVVCIAVLAVSAVVLFGGSAGLRYANADKYTAGAAVMDGPVESLDIGWLDGCVNIKYHPEKTVEISETSKKNIPADMEVRWWLDGTTLRIQYSKAGTFQITGLEKVLTVTLPEGTALKKAEITGTSSDLYMEPTSAEEVRLSSTSGDVYAEVSARRISAGSTSGNVTVTQTGETETAELTSTSGNLIGRFAEVKTVKAGSTSGSILVEAEKAGKAELSSTSGRIGTDIKSFEDLKIHATSGSISATLPELPGLSGRVSTTSGSFETGLPLTKNGDTYSCGDGSMHFDISTTSGSVRIN